MTGGPRAAICAIARDEEFYLAEWVVYHALLGFGPIRIYNHESSDGSREVLEALAAAGLCEWRDWSAPLGKKPQWLAYEDGLEELRDRADWIAFIDLDEFVVLETAKTVQDLLRDRPWDQALAVNWKVFGSAGLERHEPGLVMERFTRCARGSWKANRAVKTIAHINAIEVPRVHTCHFRPGVVYLTGSGEVIPPGEGRSTTVSHSPVRLHHYFTKSREEWAIKARRGRGAKPEGHPLKHRQPHEFDAHDRNEEEDVSLLRWAPVVRSRLDELALPTGQPSRALRASETGAPSSASPT